MAKKTVPEKVMKEPPFGKPMTKVLTLIFALIGAAGMLYLLALFVYSGFRFAEPPIKLVFLGSVAFFGGAALLTAWTKMAGRDLMAEVKDEAEKKAKNEKESKV